jgi:hydrogenase/urease accessory protein HupE
LAFILKDIRVSESLGHIVSEKVGYVRLLLRVVETLHRPHCQATHVFSSSLKDPLLHLDLVEHGTTTTTMVIMEITKHLSFAETAAKKRLHC